MRRVVSSGFGTIRFVTFAVLASATAATWLVLSTAHGPSLRARPAGAAALERLNEAHLALARQAVATAEAERRAADRAARELAEARTAAVAATAVRTVAATQPVSRRGPSNGAKAAAATGAAAAPLAAGPPLNLAFVRLAPAPPQQDEARPGLMGRIATAAGDLGSTARETLSAAAKLPAKILPSRFL